MDMGAGCMLYYTNFFGRVWRMAFQPSLDSDGIDGIIKK